MAAEINYELEGRRVEVPLEQDEIRVGRSQDNDIVINSAGISRKHARLYRDGADWKVADLGSTNGTLVNETRASGSALRHGDRIRLHDVVLTFSDPSAVGPTPDPLVDQPPETSLQTMYRSAVDFSALAEADSQGPGPEPVDRMARLVKIVTRASEALLVSDTLDRTLAQMLDLVFEHMPVQRGLIMLRGDDEADGMGRVMQQRGVSSAAGDEIRFSRTIARKVYDDKVGVLTTDAQADDRFAAGQSVMMLGIRSAMAAPLWNGDRVNGLIYVDTTQTAQAFDAFDLDLLLALGNHVAIAVERARLQQSALDKQRMERELAVARDIQLGVLPKTMPELPGYDLAGTSVPADETGGDIYDAVPLDERRLMLLLGDATGHGIGPALSVTQVRAMLRIAIRVGADLDTAFTHINDQLEQDLASNRFVTAFLGVLDASTHRITYHAAGQGPILHFHAATGTCEWLSSTTQPLGFAAGIKLGEPSHIDLAPGDLLGLMTDGIFEYEDPDEQMFGKDRVAALVREHHDKPPAELVGIVFEAAQAFGRGAAQADDITIVLARRR